MIYDLEVSLYKFLNSLHEVENTELPLKFDFISKKVGIYYILNNISDEHYKDVITLDIHFYSLDKNKIECMKMVDMVDEKVNKKILGNYWFTHKNVWLMNPMDTAGKTHYILSYNINTNYK